MQRLSDKSYHDLGMQKLNAAYSASARYAPDTNNLVRGVTKETEKEKEESVKEARNLADEHALTKQQFRKVTMKVGKYARIPIPRKRESVDASREASP